MTSEENSAPQPEGYWQSAIDRVAEQGITIPLTESLSLGVEGKVENLYLDAIASDVDQAKEGSVHPPSPPIELKKNRRGRR